GISRPVIAEGSYRPPTVDPFGTVRAALALRAIVDRRDWDLSWQLPLPGGGDAVGWDVELTAEPGFVEAACDGGGRNLWQRARRLVQPSATRGRCGGAAPARRVRRVAGARDAAGL